MASNIPRVISISVFNQLKKSSQVARFILLFTVKSGKSVVTKSGGGYPKLVDAGGAVQRVVGVFVVVIYQLSFEAERPIEQGGQEVLDSRQLFLVRHNTDNIRLFKNPYYR